MTERKWQYVSISGNTGTGKSTLLHQLPKRIPSIRFRVIDEKELHHRLLLKMFSDPVSWSYLIQFNFLLQRAISLTEAMGDEGFDVLLTERCIFDDPLFFQYYRRRINNSDKATQTYKQLFDFLTSTICKPNLIIHLRSEPKILVRRLELAIELGERPTEISGAALEEYVTTMNDAYDEWANSANQYCNQYRELFVGSKKHDEELINNACEMVQKQLLASN